MRCLLGTPLIGSVAAAATITGGTKLGLYECLCSEFESFEHPPLTPG
ncbi:MAG TPA: hypothetical protein VEX68_24255 [Bryobacteraceae bacterium]|nr:hypothetical protein [Bryobacteraceae bacterium]